MSPRYVYSDFSDKHVATATVDFTLKIIVRDDITYRVQLWDIAGQDRFQNISRVRDGEGGAYRVGVLS